VAEDADQMRSFEYPWKNTDDEIVVNMALGSLRESLLMWLKTEHGVHAETLLVSIGALAGFAAQTAALGRVQRREIPLPPGSDATISIEDLPQHLRKSGLLLNLTAKSGEIFLLGDLLNGYLVPQATSDNYTLWGLVAAAAVGTGVQPAELPDYRAMFEHVVGSIDTPEFGIAQVAKEHRPHITPRQALNIFWPRAKYILTRTDGPGPTKGCNVPLRYWPPLMDVVAAQFVIQAKNALDPRIGLALLMESAIATSKVDAKTVPQTAPPPVSG
jgi:hypothetical protein